MKKIMLLSLVLLSGGVAFGMENKESLQINDPQGKNFAQALEEKGFFSRPKSKLRLTVGDSTILRSNNTGPITTTKSKFFQLKTGDIVEFQDNQNKLINRYSYQSHTPSCIFLARKWGLVNFKYVSNYSVIYHSSQNTEAYPKGSNASDWQTATETISKPTLRNIVLTKYGWATLGLGLLGGLYWFWNR